MKKNYFVLFAVLTALLVFVGCATRPNDGYTIQLKGNPTTGYQWKCDIEDESVVILVSEEYKVDSHEASMVGVGGHWNFRFEGVSDGKTTVTFSYARIWEKNPIEVKTYEFSVNRGILTIVEGE